MIFGSAAFASSSALSLSLSPILSLSFSHSLSLSLSFSDIRSHAGTSGTGDSEPPFEPSSALLLLLLLALTFFLESAFRTCSAVSAAPLAALARAPSASRSSSDLSLPPRSRSAGGSAPCRVHSDGSATGRSSTEASCADAPGASSSERPVRPTSTLKMPEAAAPATFRVESSKKATEAVCERKRRSELVIPPSKTKTRNEEGKKMGGKTRTRVEQRRMRLARSLFLPPLPRDGPRRRPQRQPERDVRRLADDRPPSSHQPQRRGVAHRRLKRDDLVKVPLGAQAHQLEAPRRVRVVGVGEDELCDSGRNRVQQGLEGEVLRVRSVREERLVREGGVDLKRGGGRGRGGETKQKMGGFFLYRVIFLPSTSRTQKERKLASSCQCL